MRSSVWAFWEALSGLRCCRRELARRVVGIGRRTSSLRKAEQCSAVTTTTTHLARGVADADLVIVCTPVSNIVDHVCEVAAHAPSLALITDVGSTKARIVLQLQERLDSQVRFVGSHPLAGSEKTGPENASADLLQDKTTVLTPTPASDPTCVDRIGAFWRSLGSRVVRMSPEAHDAAIAMTSHVAHVVAAALAVATSDDGLPLVATGWRDTTRIAAGDPQLWLQILLTNRDEVLKSLDTFGKVLSNFRDALERRDEAQLLQLLDAGKKTRDSVGS